VCVCVPAHPGGPRQNPEGCKMVVVVVVVVLSIAVSLEKSAQAF